jgi:uroporphyrinogen-III synthase
LKTDSLKNRGIVVTRPASLAQGLASLIEAAGGKAFLFPAIEIEPLAVPPLALGRIDMAVFISPTAVREGLKHLAALQPPHLTQVVALSRGTRRELERHGVTGALAAEEGADSEALLALPELAQVAGRRIAIVRGEGGRSLLGEELRARGAAVEYVECYRRVRPRSDPAPLVAAWKSGGLHAVTVSSAQGLANLFEMLERELLCSLPLFVPHARVAAQAQRLGAREAIAAGPGDDEMLARLVAYFQVP